MCLIYCLWAPLFILLLQPVLPFIHQKVAFGISELLSLHLFSCPFSSDFPFQSCPHHLTCGVYPPPPPNFAQTCQVTPRLTLPRTQLFCHFLLKASGPQKRLSPQQIQPLSSVLTGSLWLCSEAPCPAMLVLWNCKLFPRLACCLTSGLCCGFFFPPWQLERIFQKSSQAFSPLHPLLPR